MAATSAVARADDADKDKEARQLYSQGQIHYSLGEYEQAVGAFRRAYELSGAPGLLFNIAQAHRLNGECKPALEAYRHFKRLAPTSDYRAEAETQIAALTVRCGEVTPAAPPSQAEGAKPPQSVEPARIPVLQSQPAEPATPRWSARRKTAAGLLAGGVSLGLAAGGIYWWNNGRYDDWRTTDQGLAKATSGTDPAAWLAQQQDNDARLRSIQRVDTINLILAGTAVAAVIASAVLLVLPER